MAEARIVIVGGGIAGLAAASFLSDRGGLEVVVVEAEANLAHHTTGRSAAQLIFNYGTPPLRALTRAGVGFLVEPPDGLADAPLLETRAQVTVATGPDYDGAIDGLKASAAAEGLALDEVEPAEALRLAPLLRPDSVHRAVVEPDSADIDVAGLHQAFVRNTRRNGGVVRTSAALVAASHAGEGWRIELSDATVLDADRIVDCAGAWGDVVAQRCGVLPIGLRPMRRTAFMVASPFSDSSGWPLVADAVHSWYTKPDGSQFLCSPADEIPEEPCDSRPEELDVALAIDRINTHTTLAIRSVASTWAGQRTFTPDRTMAIGLAADDPGFLWCVGQGGTGIQSAPGAGRLVADLVMASLDEPLEIQVDAAVVAALTPSRFVADGG